MPLRKQHALLLHAGLAACAVLLLGQGTAAERCERKRNQVLVGMNKSATASYMETRIEPITMTILGGVAALGSIGSIGKTMYGLIQNKRAIQEAQQLIGTFAEVSKSGCSMLAKVGDILFAELRDLDLLAGDESLFRACHNNVQFDWYAGLLRRELQQETTEMLVGKRFKAVYIESFDMILSKACDMGKEVLLRKQKERIINRLWRMDGLMEGVCGQRMPALQKANSLLQSSNKAQTSTRELFAMLGIAFTIIAFVDMAVDISDSIVNYMWGSSSQMLSTFLQKQLEQMTGLLCNQAKALWEETTATIHAGRAVSRVNFYLGLFQNASVPFHSIPNLHDNVPPREDSPQIWGLEKDSFWLCQTKTRKSCLQKFEAQFVPSTDLGLTHPSQCLGLQDQLLPMTAICVQNKVEIDHAVPSSCFATLLATTGLTNQETKKQLGMNKKSKKTFWAVQFYPSIVDDIDFERRPDISQCKAPLDELWKLQRTVDADLLGIQQAISPVSNCGK
mmetsp:Transcript_81157/g.160900  ORF Transcript_81157/g.160900 Transcript_81157/m.160900 type:complete len:506 (+) Transcript_81157:67-1584(+)